MPIVFPHRDGITFLKQKVVQMENQDSAEKADATGEEGDTAADDS